MWRLSKEVWTYIVLRLIAMMILLTVGHFLIEASVQAGKQQAYQEAFDRGHGTFLNDNGKERWRWFRDTPSSN